MIPFNVPPCVGDELDYVKQAIDSHKICGDGAFTKKCNAWLEERFGAQKVLLTTSGTTALDMAMLLCAQHISRSPYFQVPHGDLDSGAQLRKFPDCLEALLRLLL